MKTNFLRFLFFSFLLSCALPVKADTVTIQLKYQGNWSSDLKKNLSAFLSIHTIHPKESTSAFRIRKLHKQATEEITTALQAYGYYQPRITADLSQTAPEKWLANYTIDPGQQIHIRYRTVAITGPGHNLIDLGKILKTSKIKPNAPLLHQEYENLKKQLSETLYRAGYLDVNFTKTELNIYPELGLADINLVLDTGHPYYFGEINLQQNILDPDFIQKFIPFKSGELLDTDKLLQLQFNLNDSRFFDQIEINTHKEAAQDFHVPVDVITTPSKPQKYTVGLGYSTDTGPRLKLGSEFLRVNPQGHQITADAAIAQHADNYTVNYRIPFKNTLNDYWNFSVQESSEQISQSDHKSDALLLSASRNEIIWNGTRRLYLNYEQTHFTIDTIDQSELLMPGVQWVRLNTNHPLYPTRGSKLDIDVHGAYDHLIATTSFFKTDIIAGKIMPLAPQTRLLINGEWGTVRASNFDQLPPSQRFFSGGDRTVRGYRYLSLGPATEIGEAKGGAFLSRASVEMDTLFYKNFGAAIFYDVGSVTEHPQLDLNRSAGIGFRWRSPVGMLRVDFAHPFDDPSTSYRLHVSIGPDL